MIQARLNHRKPKLAVHSVCLDCKRRGTVCIAVAQDVACIGPVTQAGCGAICPSYNRGCYGCYGPAAPANCESLSNHYLAGGKTTVQLVPLLRNFNADAPAFRNDGDRIDPDTDQGSADEH